MCFMNKSGFFLAIVFAAGAAFLHAQSAAAEIEMLLGTNAVTYAQAARFLLEASDTMATADPQEAFRYAEEQNWLPKDAAADKPARLDGVSLLLMRSFGIQGGILYSITKNPHYAYRELTYVNVIQGRSDPRMDVSGERLLFITGRLLGRREDHSENSLLSQIAERAAIARRALAARINAMLERQNVADTVAEATDEGIVIRLSNIQFMADSTQLPQSEIGKLVEIANILRTIPDKKVQVAGHTAYAGTVEGQRELSLERAKVVAAYLVELKAHDASDIIAIGYGADRPIADNSTPEGRAINRRVEIIIMEN